MKLSCLLVLCALGIASGELLAALRRLHTSHMFDHLSPEDQVLLVEVVAAAEACKLLPFIHDVGRDKITALIVHLPDENEAQAQKYVQDHIHAEQQGTCHVV